MLLCRSDAAVFMDEFVFKVLPIAKVILRWDTVSMHFDVPTYV